MSEDIIRGNALDDVTLYRYPDPEPECEHGATHTGRLRVIDHKTRSLVATGPLVTFCLVCHDLAPAPQEAAQ